MSWSSAILIGMTEEEAVAELEREGLPYYIEREGEESGLKTADFNPLRMNLIIKDGVVTSVHGDDVFL